MYRILDALLAPMHPEQIDYFNNVLSGPFAPGIKNNDPDYAGSLDPWRGRAAFSRVRMEKDMTQIYGKTNLNNGVTLGEDELQWVSVISPENGPRDADTWYWPVFSGMLAEAEREFLLILGRGSEEYNKLKAVQFDVEEADSEGKSDSESEESKGVWLGNAFNMWPKDELIGNGVLQDSKKMMDPDILYKDERVNTWDLSETDSTSLSLTDPTSDLPYLGAAFKVYVYDPEEIYQLKRLTNGPHFCRRRGKTGAEVAIHNWFLSCPKCLTKNPDEADYFFVPGYAGCHFNEKTFGDTEEESSRYLNNLYKSLVTTPAEPVPRGITGAGLPYFQRSNGRDHIFVWTESVDKLFPDWRRYLSEAIFLSANDDGGLSSAEPEEFRSEEEKPSAESSGDASSNPYDHRKLLEPFKLPSFSVHKDLAIPALVPLDVLYEQAAVAAADAATPDEQAVAEADARPESFPPAKDWETRRFTGHCPLHRNVENSEAAKSLQHWMDVYRLEGQPQSGKAFFGDFHIKGKKTEEVERFWAPGNSKFCFIPFAEELPRMMFSGCVPILMNNAFELPFQQAFSVQDLASKFFWRDGENAKNVLKSNLLNYLIYYLTVLT